MAILQGTCDEAWDHNHDALDDRLSMVQVEPRVDENNDDNIPRNLHNAAELFLASGNLRAAKRVQKSTIAFFKLVEQQPQKNTVKLGRACVCWTCGHCGLMRDTEAAEQEAAHVGVCSGCGDTQTNYVYAVSRDGSTIPWMESADLRLEKEATTVVGVETISNSDLPVTDDHNTIDGLDERLQSFQVIPNDGEEAHPSFPHNLHNAMELFMHVNRISAARHLQKCTNHFFQVLEGGPLPGDVTGQARVCFECGHCGLAPESLQSNGVHDKAGTCGNCGQDSHTNLVKLVLPNGRQLPWIERGTNSKR